MCKFDQIIYVCIYVYEIEIEKPRLNDINKNERTKQMNNSSLCCTVPRFDQ